MEASDLPFTITPVNDPDFFQPMVHVNEWLVLEKYLKYARDILNFPISKEQAWVIGFKRSGTTMMQELVWLIQHDCDFEGAKVPNQERVLFLDACFVRDVPMPNDDQLSDKTRTVIKTHLPFELLHPKLLDTCKVVFMSRNPKDVAVSSFHFFTKQTVFASEWKMFEEDRVPSGPFWRMTLQGWEKRNHPNVLFLFYEDTQKDMRGTILKVADHLGKKLTEDQIAALMNHMDIRNFKENKAVNHHFMKESGELKHDFIRQGGVGGWRKFFDEELQASADAWIKKNTEGMDFAFPEH